jgi:hypothetical protein
MNAPLGADPKPLSGTSLVTRFDSLSSVLRDARPLWAPRPFTGLPVPWEQQHPRLAQWLRALTDEELDVLEGESQLPDDAPPLGDWRPRLQTVSAVGPAPRGKAPLDAPGLSRHVPGRKWSQIQAFGPAALHLLGERTTRLVDWCAGKGHLGRSLSAVTGLPSVAVELQAHLCERGAEHARRASVPCTFVEADVLSAPRPAALNGAALAVSLHACGVLTDRLLRHTLETGAGVAAAMCCYHNLAGQTRNTPLSARGRAAGLELNQHELRLAILNETVAPNRERTGRRREMSYRLGLDLLLRRAHGKDVYTPLGPIPKGDLRRGFGDFCQTTAERLSLPLPRSWDPALAETAGTVRARHVRSLALVRGLFRRPLELWLVLDRALFLQEGGRDVSVGTFCSPTLTPRNLLITSRGSGLAASRAVQYCRKTQGGASA